MTASAVIEERARSEKRFGAARAELDLLLQSARAIAAAERSSDPANSHLAQIGVGIEGVLARSLEQKFQVAVVALVKSGKSTLINALLGGEFLPSSNVPETAAIVRITHAPQDAEGTLRDAGGPVARGRVEIHGHLRQLNARLRTSGAAPAPERLVLEAPFAALAGRPLGGQRFEVLDTPGPNEAGSDTLRTTVDRLLDEADVILYLLDYTKLGTDEERGIFERLAGIRPELLGRLSERLFFVVNKIDQVNSNALSPGETRRYVAQLLRSQVRGLRIEPDRVLLLSAEQALLARLVRSRQASIGALRDFARLWFGLRGQNRGTLEDCAPHAPALLEASLLPEVEDRVVSFLYEHRGRLCLQSLLDDLERHLSHLHNHLQTASGALRFERDRLADQVRGLEADLARADAAFGQIDEQAVATAARIEAWARERFSYFREEIEAALVRALGGEGAGPAAPDPSRPGAWHALADLFADRPGAPGRQPEFADEAAAGRRIAQAHDTIAAILRAEFTAFWADLELGAWERQREMFGELEARIAPLAALVGELVGNRFEVALRPVRLRLPTPSFDALHDEIARQISRFVERATRKQPSQESRRVLARKGGWCSDDQYRRQVVGVSRDVTVFALSRDGVLAYWRDWIGQRTQVSVETAGAIIRQEVGAAATEARRQLAEYRDGYLRAVRSSLAESGRGGRQGAERLSEVEATQERLRTLQQRLDRCREFLGEEELA